MAFAPFNPPVSRIPVIAVAFFFFYKAHSVGGKGGEHRLKESLCDASSTTVAPQSTRPSLLFCCLPGFALNTQALFVQTPSLPLLGRLVKRLWGNFSKGPVVKNYVLNGGLCVVMLWRTQEVQAGVKRCFCRCSGLHSALCSHTYLRLKPFSGFLPDMQHKALESYYP